MELRLGDVVIAFSAASVGPAQGLPTDDAVAVLRLAGAQALVEPCGHVSGHRRAYVTDPDGSRVALVSEAGQ